MMRKGKFIFIGICIGLIISLVNSVEIVLTNHIMIFQSFPNFIVFFVFSLLNAFVICVITLIAGYACGAVLSLLSGKESGAGNKPSGYGVIKKTSQVLLNIKTPVYLLLFLVVFVGFNRWFISRHDLDPLMNPTRPFKKHTSLRTERPNVMIIVLDTLRAKSLHSYGHEKVNMPHLDQFFKEGTLFKNTISTASHTAPSHLAMISGNFVDSEVMSVPVEKTLTELLNEEGYLSLGVFANELVTSKNFIRGFDIYVDHITSPLLYQFFLTYKMAYRLFLNKIMNPQLLFYFENSRAENVNKVLFPLLEKYRNENLFIFVNYIDPHDPYFPLEPKEEDSPYSLENGFIRYLPYWKNPDLDKDQWDNINDLYLQELQYLDKYLGDLFEKMKRLDIWDKTIVIITSDHGELLGEKGLLTHAIALHEEEIRIPLAIRYPQEIPEGLHIKQQVQTLDIAPTVCELLKIESPQNTHGKSLLPFIRGYEYPEYPGLAFSLQYEFRALQNDEWKCVYNLNKKTVKLFNLKSDPDERFNVASEYPEKKEYFLDMYSLYKKKYESQPENFNIKSHEERLRSLGYIR
mgnify:CR=1 FL=1